MSDELRVEVEELKKQLDRERRAREAERTAARDAAIEARRADFAAVAEECVRAGLLKPDERDALVEFAAALPIESDTATFSHTVDGTEVTYNMAAWFKDFAAAAARAASPTGPGAALPADRIAGIDATKNLQQLTKYV
jgi:hypothetical protein